MGLGKGHRHDLSGPPVVVTENVEDYRKAISVYLNRDDVVLELGCAQGVTTGLIGEAVREVIGIDKSEFQTGKAQARNPNVQFHNIDAYDAGAVLKLGRRFTAIFIDVSGSRPVGDVVQLIDRYEAVFQPRVFVVKCYKLKRLMAMCRVYPEDCMQGQPLFTGNQHRKLHPGPCSGLGTKSTSSQSSASQQLMSYDLNVDEDEEEGKL